jgi:hypothetical protein
MLDGINWAQHGHNVTSSFSCGYAQKLVLQSARRALDELSRARIVNAPRKPTRKISGTSAGGQVGFNK